MTTPDERGYWRAVRRTARSAVRHVRYGLGLDGASQSTKRGQRLMEQGRIYEAVDCFRAAGRHRFKDEIAKLAPAYLQYLDGNLLESLKVLSDLTSHPSDEIASLALSLSGRCHERLGEAKEAIADYTDALMKDDRLAIGYYRRGLLYEAAKRPHEAYSDFLHFIELRPDDLKGQQAFERVAKDFGEVSLAKVRNTSPSPQRRLGES